MTLTAELPLVVSAIALALVALVLAFPDPDVARRRTIGLIIAIVGLVAPIAIFAARQGALGTSSALWEWSAVGGPTIRASYRFDGIAAIGVALAVGYGAAGLLAGARAAVRRPLLPGLVLAVALVSIALHVTEDLVAAIVVLGAIGAITAFITLLVAPPPASARLATFLAIGIQAFVVAALLVSRFGGASFSYDAIRPTWISPGVILSASLGAALFAGLYPFVPWRFESATAAEREPLRGLLAMPAGIGASLVLLRLLGATRGDVVSLGLPGADPALRAGAVIVIGVAVAIAARRHGTVSRAALLAGALGIAASLSYPSLHWSHVVLGAALLTVLYAAAVSLARPDEWDVVRYDVALAGFWIGIAVGTPLTIAGGLVLLVAEALAALVENTWMPPHIAQIGTVVTSSIFVASVLAVGAGVSSAPDLFAQGLAAVVLLALLSLELVHIGRRLSVAFAPPELDVTAAASAFLVGLLAAMLLALPISAALSEIDRPLLVDASAPLVVAALAMSSTVIVLVARSVRPFLPDLAPVGARLRSVVSAADPVPAGMAAFRTLERTATVSSAAFALFERRAGVWLATLLIVALLFWATRS